jgi:hypothetical protein
VAALWASGAHAERRVALEFDDGAYDAQDLSAALKLDGVDHHVEIDLDKAGMDEAEFPLADELKRSIGTRRATFSAALLGSTARRE